jgi:hypothetical protein
MIPFLSRSAVAFQLALSGFDPNALATIDMSRMLTFPSLFKSVSRGLGLPGMHQWIVVCVVCIDDV